MEPPTLIFLGHTIFPAGFRPNADKVAALMKMPMPLDIKELRSLLGGLSYYRKFLADMAKRVRPITSLLKQGMKFVFTPAMEVIGRPLLKELSAPPVLVYPDWDAVADNSRPFLLLYCDACVHGLEPHLSRNQRTAQYALLFLSAVLPSSLSDTGPRSTSRLAASSGVSSASEDICGVPPCASFRTTRRSKASPRLPSTTPESRDGSNFSQRTAILSSTARAAQTETPTFYPGYRCPHLRTTGAAAVV